MGQNEDIVWDTITDSAKTRFNYESFKKDLSEFDDGTIAENVLFLTILGHAQEREIGSIVSEISHQFLLLGLIGTNDEIKDFVEARLSDLPIEIKATKHALALSEMGQQTPRILVQVRSILEKANQTEQGSDGND